MILSKTPLTLVEAKSHVKSDEENAVLNDYFKAYSKLNLEKSIALKKEISDLNNVKIKEEHMVKIVDFLPSDSEDLSKIFIDVSLNEEESNAILEIVKKY
jgi:DNA-directed RNA polymerase subunit F